jgi:RNA polymerase sigma-70 factor, ECF subfamily
MDLVLDGEGRGQLAPRGALLGPAGDAAATDRMVSRAVRRAQSGDRDAFAFLYARYAEDVYSYVRSIVRDHHEAEDVTQHVFAKLLRAIGSYQERKAPFLAWVLRVARNSALDHLRHRRLVPVEGIQGSGTGDGGLYAAWRLSDLKEALAVLTHEQREVVVLRHLAGLTQPEIAVMTGKSATSVHGLHHRGVRALSAELVNREAQPRTRRRCAGA